MALGRAVVAEAPICLMDEPLSNLDAQLRAEMRREIHGLQRRLGITMVYVTHDQTEAMADQVVLLRAGRIEADATPAALYARPGTMFAAGFIGTRPEAYETPALKAYLRQVPAAGVARHLLPVATGELSTYENQRVYKLLTDNIQAALTGTKTPERAMADAQAEADRILRPFKRA